jgi:RNA-directed DNA polymerase
MGAVLRVQAPQGGRSISSVVAELRGYLVGWKNYFQLADTPSIFGELDKWIRQVRRPRVLYP